jgi:hypothetical protein
VSPTKGPNCLFEASLVQASRSIAWLLELDSAHLFGIRFRVSSKFEKEALAGDLASVATRQSSPLGRTNNSYQRCFNPTLGK